MPRVKDLRFVKFSKCQAKVLLPLPHGFCYSQSVKVANNCSSLLMYIRMALMGSLSTRTPIRQSRSR